MLNSPDTAIPHGSPLLENMTLPVSDVEMMLENLLQDSFAGIVQLKLPNGSGFFVLRDETIVRSMECDKRGNLIPRLPARLYALMHQRSTSETSVYVTSETMVGILASSFTFSDFVPERRVKPKDLKSVLTNVENQNITGYMTVEGPNGNVTLLLEDGHILTERFAERYGNIVCGPAQVSALLDHVHQNGSRVSVKGEKSDEVAQKIEVSNADLARIRPMTLKKASALFRSSEEVKLSEDVFREWGLDSKSQFQLEIEVADGRMFTYKCKSGSTRLGTRVEVHSNMLKQMGAAEGDPVNIRPLI